MLILKKQKAKKQKQRQLRSLKTSDCYKPIKSCTVLMAVQLFFIDRKYSVALTRSYLRQTMVIRHV